VGATSATTYAIVGTANKLPIAIIGQYLFETHMTRQGWIFVGVNMAGCALYSACKVMESQAKQRAKLKAKENDDHGDNGDHGERSSKPPSRAPSPFASPESSPATQRKSALSPRIDGHASGDGSGGGGSGGGEGGKEEDEEDGSGGYGASPSDSSPSGSPSASMDRIESGRQLLRHFPSSSDVLLGLRPLPSPRADSRHEGPVRTGLL